MTTEREQTATESQPGSAASSTRHSARATRRASPSPPPRQRRRSRSRDPAVSESGQSGEEHRPRVASPSRLRSSLDAAAPEANEAWAALVASGKVPSAARLPGSSSWSTLPSSSSLASIVSASAIESHDVVDTTRLQRPTSAAEADGSLPSALLSRATAAEIPDRKRKSNVIHSGRASPSTKETSSPLNASRHASGTPEETQGGASLSNSTAARLASSQGQRVVSAPNPARGQAAPASRSARRSASPGQQRGSGRTSEDSGPSRGLLNPEQQERGKQREAPPAAEHKYVSWLFRVLSCARADANLSQDIRSHDTAAASDRLRVREQPALSNRGGPASDPAGVCARRKGC
jgi:hypothetical protein